MLMRSSSMAKDKNPSRGNLLKRKRPQEPKNADHQFILENHNSDVENFPIADKEVMIKGINKLKTNVKELQTSRKRARICLRVCYTEAEYLTQEESLIEQLKLEFSIQDLTISSPFDGAIDRFVWISGDAECALRAAVYISFLLAAKASNLAHLQLYTLKSSNYSLTLVLSGNPPQNSTAANTGLRRFEVTPYALNPSVKLISVTGDLGSLLAISTSVYAEVQAPDESLIQPPDIYANINRAGLYKRTPENEALLSSNSNDIFRRI